MDKSFSWLESLYARVLKKSLKRPGLVLLGALVLFLASLAVFMIMPSEFVPSQDQSLVIVRLQTAVGSSLEETDRLVKKAEAIVSGQARGRRACSAWSAAGAAASARASSSSPWCRPRSARLSQAEFSAALRKELNSIPGVRAVIQDLSQAGFTAQRGFPVEFSVRGPDWDKLIAAEPGDDGASWRASGMVVDLDTDYQLGMPELRITPDRARIADIGVSVDDVATTLNALVGGVRVGKYSTGGRRLDVRLQLLAAQRSRPEDLARLQVRTRSGELVPLSALVTYEEQPALQAITRRDRERAITVFANVAPGHSQDEALNAVETLGKDLPVGYRAVLGGASVAFRESSSSLLFALLLGIVVAYMILASQFNSFLHPVTVLTILPLSIAGAAFALWSTDQSLNIFSMIGLLLLMGIVKKNSIILVDYANKFREAGLCGARGHGEGRPDPPAADRHDRRRHPDGRHPAGPGPRARARRSACPWPSPSSAA